MYLQNGQITVSQLLSNPKARALLAREFPQFINSPMIARAGGMPLRGVLSYARRFIPPQRLNQLIRQLEQL